MNHLNYIRDRKSRALVLSDSRAIREFNDSKDICSLKSEINTLKEEVANLKIILENIQTSKHK